MTRDSFTGFSSIRRIERDKKRFDAIIRGRIKQDLRKHITRGELIGKRGREVVSIPMPQIELPRLKYGRKAIQKQLILEANDEDTRRTYLYTGKTSRATYSRFHDLWEKSGLEPLPFPMQVLLASGLVEMFRKAEKRDYMGPFAGQVVGLIKEIKPAAEILEDMVEEAAEILTRKLPERVIAK